ncbi:iron chelate uptake ABC transporter family permease subunit, partial [Aeromonas salmonicida]|uniref:iron chelate uptake ABC transporter family permease subunit n=1 Tax=Aeromonas salmonicida TaxID=645 RepID=UPI003D30FABA
DVYKRQLLFGQGMHGWSWPSWLRWQAQLEWRLPRTLAAGAAGGLLALAGTPLQRGRQNPLAGPGTVSYKQLNPPPT